MPPHRWQNSADFLTAAACISRRTSVSLLAILAVLLSLLSTVLSAASGKKPPGFFSQSFGSVRGSVSRYDFGLGLGIGCKPEIPLGIPLP